MGIVLIQLVTEKISTDGGFWCKYGNGEGEKLRREWGRVNLYIYKVSESNFTNY